MTPTTAAVTVSSAAARRRLPRRLSMYGAPRKIHRKQGANVAHTATRAPMVPASERIETARVLVRADEPDELEHHDERAGSALGESEPDHHLSGEQPPVGLHRRDVHVGEHRVGASERDERGAREEPAHVGERVAAASPSRRRARSARATRRVRRRAFSLRAPSTASCARPAARRRRGRCAPVPRARGRPRPRTGPGAAAPPTSPISAAASTISGNGTCSTKIATNEATGDAEHERVGERLLPDADRRRRHDRDHRRREARRRSR